MADNRLPPNDIDAEEAVIGSLLIDGKSIYQVAVLLRPRISSSSRTAGYTSRRHALQPRRGYQPDNGGPGT